MLFPVAISKWEQIMETYDGIHSWYMFELFLQRDFYPYSILNVVFRGNWHYWNNFTPLLKKIVFLKDQISGGRIHVDDPVLNDYMMIVEIGQVTVWS